MVHVSADYLHLYRQSTCIIKEDLPTLCSADLCSNDRLNQFHMCLDVTHNVPDQWRVSDMVFVLA